MEIALGARDRLWVDGQVGSSLWAEISTSKNRPTERLRLKGRQVAQPNQLTPH
jgi:hypothetical protein